MRITILLRVFLAAAILAHARPDPASNPIRLRSDQLKAQFVTNCESWRLAVETHNARKWKVVPAQCVGYVASYMLNLENQIEAQYDADCGMVVAEALEYLETVSPTKGGKDTWLFDFTDTLLSNIKYYNRSDTLFGGLPFDWEKYKEWFPEGEMPAVPYIKELYLAAQEKGFKIVILSGISEKFKSVVEAKLKKAKFDNWDKLILKDKPSMPTRDFKASTRAQLKKDGYKVIGNVGDQWSTDLLTGGNVGKRTFKIPNSMYYTK